MRTLQRRLVRLAAAAVAVIGWGGVIGAPTGASASMISFFFSGAVTSTFTFGSATIPDGITPSDPVSGFLTYDSSVSDLNADSELGEYFDPLLFISIEFYGGSVFTQTSGQIQTTNNGSGDSWITASDASSVFTGPGLLLSTSASLFQVEDQTAPFDLLQSDLLLGTFPPFALAAITSAGGVINTAEGVVCGGTCDTNAVADQWIIQYSIDTNSIAAISPIPLPAALPLFGSALAMLGIVGWRRRRREAVA